MSWIFAAARFYPYWSFPIILILWDLTLHFRRKRSSSRFMTGGVAVFMTVCVVVWFVQRGDLHSDRWVRWLFG